MTLDVERYLDRIGLAGQAPNLDLAGLTELHRAHLTAVPFENLDIVFADGVPIDPDAAINKIVDHGRGGWCFELNGAFAALLGALGFEVRLLGAAVLLDGPSTVLEHLALEVQLDQPYLVDVGFGDSFDVPLALNRSGPQDGGSGTFALIPSPQGTTLTEHVDGVPAARFRFKRVAHDIDDFAPIAAEMQSDTGRSWGRIPFATRLLAGGPDRVTVRGNAAAGRREWSDEDESPGRLTIRRGGVETREDVAASAFPGLLEEWFSMRVPG